MDEIFSDFGTNVNMLKGSYKKLKAYYYYNKNFILMREKIANFEQNEDKMMQTFNKLAECLAHHRKKTNKEYLDNLIKRIDFYVLPKKFDFPNKDKKTIVTNITRNKNLKTVNFFIDMPIELHILDTLWTLFLGKISYEEGLLLILKTIDCLTCIFINILIGEIMLLKVWNKTMRLKRTL